MQVTINDARYAVILALDTAFPEIPVSGEEIKQLLDPPRLFVRLLQPAHTQELGRRYRRDLPFVVRYFAKDRTNADMYGMAEQLTTALKWISFGDSQVPGQRMYFEIVDETLHFFVTYQCLVWEGPEPSELMQSLNERVTLNGQTGTG